MRDRYRQRLSIGCARRRAFGPPPHLVQAHRVFEAAQLRLALVREEKAFARHELAHHVAFHTHGFADHGPSYTACMLDLVARALGEEAAFALRVDYGEHDVV